MPRADIVLNRILGVCHQYDLLCHAYDKRTLFPVTVLVNPCGENKCACGITVMVRQFTTESGKTIFVGESAAENQRLCKNAKQNDEWFHLDNGPSPHVILSCGGKPASRDDIHDCAQLVKYFSKHRFVHHSTYLPCAQQTDTAQEHATSERASSTVQIREQERSRGQARKGDIEEVTYTHGGGERRRDDYTATEHTGICIE